MSVSKFYVDGKYHKTFDFYEAVDRFWFGTETAVP